MKLPGIEYKKRGPLARVDPSTYLALGQAQAGVSKAVSETAGNVYEQESVSEMQEAFLNYTEQMDIWGEDQGAYSTNEETGEPEGAWVGGPKRYEDNERELRDTISKRFNTPLARRLFNEKANQLNVRNKEVYRGKLQQWRKEHEVAGVYTRLNRQLENKNFQGARDSLVESYTVGTIGEDDAAKELIKVNYQEKYYGYSLKVDALETPKDAIKFHEQVGNSSLKDSDKNKLYAAIASKFHNAQSTVMHSTIIDAESVNGSKQEGYSAGVKRFEKLMRTDPSELGGDARFKEQVLATASSILNRYKPEVVKQTVENKRYRNADDFEAERRVVGAKFNVQMHDDYFAFKNLNFQAEGKTGFNRKFDHPEPSMRGMEDPDILKNANGVMDKFVDYSDQTGLMPKYVKDLMNASLTHGNGELAPYAVETAYKLMQKNPYALWRNGENNDLTQVATLSELMGGSPDSHKQAFNLWKQSQNLSKEQRDVMLGSKKDRNTFFDENFDSMLEKQYGAGNKEWYNLWQGSTATVKERYKLLARKMMDNYTVINKGSFERGLQSAIISMKGSYSPSGANGGYTIMKNAPEMAVQNGNKNGGAWLFKQLTADVIKNYGEDVDMSKISIESVDKWNPDDPAYVIYLDDDTLMRRTLGVEIFDYSISPEYKEAEAEIKALEAANKRTVEMNKKRIQWDKEQPPEARKRGRTRKKVNPYGRTPKLSPIGKAVIGFGKGMEAMRKGSESEAEARLRREERERIEAAKPKKRLTRRGLR